MGDDSTSVSLYRNSSEGAYNSKSQKLEPSESSRTIESEVRAADFRMQADPFRTSRGVEWADYRDATHAQCREAGDCEAQATVDRIDYLDDDVP